ncbi:glycosyltransferase family A protein [Aurantiacibacter sp. MUD11]|nr:glycosyltransferase family A protein [Aurantiacibacter sp. MUD11]WAT19303.1 glycosyltransferase family A protein [Aurantiacibacter sp. MUD11]
MIMPVFCGEKFIEEAIGSVLAQPSDWIEEIIVVDDGSTDATAAIVKACRGPIRYVYQDNSGPQHARNTGLALAKGNAVAFLDADDIWTPDKLALQLPLLEEADVVLGQTKILDDPDSAPFILPSLCCALMRKSAFDRIGNFDTELEYSDDLDWYLRAKEEELVFRVHKDTVLKHRRHENNLTKNKSKTEHYHLLMLLKSVKRRKGKGITEMPGFSDLTFLDRP